MVKDKHKHIVAMTAILVSKNKVLVIQRGKDEIAFPDKWGFPGGKIEQGETPTECLKREVMEEVGIEADNFTYMRDYTFMRPDGHNVVGLAFFTNTNIEEVKLHSDFQEFRWVTLEELKQLDVIVPEIIDEAKHALKQS